MTASDRYRYVCDTGPTTSEQLRGRAVTSNVVENGGSALKEAVMDKARWWTPDTIFVTGMGVVMTVVLGCSLFARLGSQTGSDLVPATTLQKVLDHEARCQTIDRNQVNEGSTVPRTPC
jgi:hypothetical protein